MKGPRFGAAGKGVALVRGYPSPEVGVLVARPPRLRLKETEAEEI